MIERRTPHGSGAKKLELNSWLGALAAVKILEAQPDLTLPDLCHRLAITQGDQPALRDEHQSLSYAQLSQRIDGYAHWTLAQDLAPGDTVCLLMHNCPEYAAIWLGLSQQGCSVALMNTSLGADALAHCVVAASSRHLIFAARFLPVVQAALPSIPAGIRIWMHGAAEMAQDYPRIDLEIEPRAGRTDNACQPAAQNVALLIYTSGTTGLPKAVRLTNARIIEWSFWFAGLLNVQPSDRLYDCLPLYHSTGGIVALGAILVSGASAIIRERFSASRFWDDIVKENCTIFFYIGELCRYLTLAPSHDGERQHRLRICCGNGLEISIWENFQERFAIPRIIEFYAATEGSVSLYNCAGQPGAIGHVPAFLKHSFPVILVKTNVATGEVLRRETGMCELCEADEIGEALGKICGASPMPARQFDGYTDATASAHKVLRNVLTPGDAWFRTGDLLRQDAQGYYYFVERSGETFRWKGENVSTEEVAQVLRRCAGILEAVVFGVAIPFAEGRAGMAAITTGASFAFPTLLTHVERHLPYYARPLFTRVCETMDLTGTFKYKKDRLIREGISPSGTDRVWFYDRQMPAFIACDDALRRQISDGTRRL